MSRIEDILAKAARDGQIQRTSPLDAAVAPDASRAPAIRPEPRPTAVALSRSTPAAGGGPMRSRQAEPTEPRRFAEAVPPAPAVQAPRTARVARPHPSLVAAASPHSRVAEQYRAIRTRIAQVEGERPCRTILVTSPLANDGKTLTAVNLALTMGQEFHRRILAIDADLRSGSLHRLFGLEPSPGLSDVLLGRTPLEEALVSLPDFHITLLPVGSPCDQPAELLGSAEMRRLVDVLQTQFDRLVIDAPPASPLADVAVVSPLADGVVLVVRAGRTPRPAIDAAIEALDADRLLGIVLNDVSEPGTETRP